MNEVARDLKGRWLPGTAPNPGGRPRAIEQVQTLARTHTAEAVATLVEICGNRKAHPSARVAAASAILDRGWGRPMQSVQVEAQASVLPSELAALSPEDKRKAAEIIMRGLAAESAKQIDAVPSEPSMQHACDTP